MPTGRNAMFMVRFIGRPITDAKKRGGARRRLFLLSPLIYKTRSRRDPSAGGKRDYVRLIRITQGEEETVAT